MEMHISHAKIEAYQRKLTAEERSPGTIEKYRRDIAAFGAWLKGRELCRETVTGWKEHLLSAGYQPATINSMLSALNGFFQFIGREDCRAKFLRVQRRMFRDSARDLSKEDYERLVQTADAIGNTRLRLLIEAICATGIRVSELQYITVEAVRAGRAQISLKGKIRIILLPGKLCRKLQKYAQKRKIASGEIFLTRSGNTLSRRQIWREMKKLCGRADVDSNKVFPHNLRHLFAVTFYKSCRDIVKLADVLGHSSIETTRIYLISTGEEHVKQLDRLGLVS